MKLCSFRHGARASFGIVRDDGAISDLGAALGVSALHDLLAATDGAPDLRDLARRDAPLLDPADVASLPPVTRPGKVMGVAINNRMGQAIAYRRFADPAFFLKPTSSLIGAGAAIEVSAGYGLTHPEPELAVVIGRGGRDIAESDALDHVFGYTIINDVTSPGLKERDSIELVTPRGAPGGYQALMGWRNVRDAEDARSIYLTYHAMSKGADTFGPIGPWIVTADAIGDPNALAITSYAGDEAVFVDSTANLTFGVERIIAHASRYMTLAPGDILHCGTAMKAAENGRYAGLAEWNLVSETRPVSIEIDGIGRLTNPVRVRA